MELKEVLLKRRSIRKFKDQLVPDEYIDELLHAAMSGPSACNRVPWEFYVIQNADLLKKLKSTTLFTKIDAPLAIIVCGNLHKALPLKMASYWIQDCSAATENILLRAVDLGLGSVWCGVHPQEKGEKKIRELLNLDEKLIPLNIIFIGYPDQDPKPRDQYDEKKVHIIK